MNEFKFIDHPADIAVEVKSDSIEGLFKISAEAWKISALEEFTAANCVEMKFELKDNSLEGMLVGFLSELNYLLYVKSFVFVSVKSLSLLTSDNYLLKAELNFEEYNTKKHIFKEEIKAVTFHQMEIEKINNIFCTRIIFDI